MSTMNVNYLNAIADHGASLVTFIGLVNNEGQEVGDSRKPVTWTASADGTVRPQNNLEFLMSAGETVSGWRAYSAGTAGIMYGGADLGVVTFGNPGQYTLVAADTGIHHTTAP